GRARRPRRWSLFGSMASCLLYLSQQGGHLPPQVHPGGRPFPFPAPGLTRRPDLFQFGALYILLPQPAPLAPEAIEIGAVKLAVGTSAGGVAASHPLGEDDAKEGDLM